MSYRGRVIRRQPVAVFEKPRSVQDQMEQYKYLSRLLHIRQYETQSWASATRAISWLKQQNLIVSMSSVWPEWPSGVSQFALVLRPGHSMSLSLLWNDITGVTFQPSVMREGFVLLNSDDTWSNLSRDAGTWQPSAIPHPAAVNVSTDGQIFSANWYMKENSIVDQGSFIGPWMQPSGMVKAVYYVNPLFSAVLLEPEELESFGNYITS